MNIKPQYLNFFALAFSVVASLAAVAGLVNMIIPFLVALNAPSELLMACGAVITSGLAVLFVALTFMLRMAFLATAAAYLRGTYAFCWLSRSDIAKASLAYREWLYERDGQLQMGLIFGRLQIVLMGYPQAYPSRA